MNTLIMRQTSKYMWRIVSQNGTIVQDNIPLNNGNSAYLYIKNYVSSYNNWDYVVETMKGEPIYDKERQIGIKE